MKVYKDYKTFNTELFKREIGEILENHTTYDYSYLQNIFIVLLNKHAPVKKNIIRFNNNPFIHSASRQQTWQVGNWPWKGATHKLTQSCKYVFAIGHVEN